MRSKGGNERGKRRDLVPWYLPGSAYNHYFSGGQYLLNHSIMDDLLCCAPCAVDPRVQFSGTCTKPSVTDQHMQQGAICYQLFKQRLIRSVSKPSISQRLQIKEDTVEPSVLARDIILW